MPLATLNTVGAAPFTWNVPGLRAGAGHRPDPVAAQAAAGELRAGARRRPAVPRGGAAGGGAAARRAVALPPLAHRRARPRGRLGLGEGARPPAAHVPRRRRAGRRGRRGQGPRGAQAAAASVVRPGDAPGRRRVRGHRDRARRRGPSARSSRPSPGRAPVTRCTASRRSSTRAARSGCGSPPRPTSRRPTTVSAYDGCCCSRVPSPVGSLVDGLDNAAKLGLAASPYPNVRALVEDCVVAAAGELVDRRRRCVTRRRSTALVERARSELPGALGRRAAPGAAGAGGVATGRQGAARTRRPGAAAGDDRPARAARPAGARRVRRARPGRPRCASTPATSGRWPRGSSGSASCAATGS